MGSARITVRRWLVLLSFFSSRVLFWLRRSLRVIRKGNANFPTSKLTSIELIDSLNSVTSLHFNKSKTFKSSCVLVVDHDNGSHGTEMTEEFIKLCR